MATLGVVGVNRTVGELEGAGQPRMTAARAERRTAERILTPQQVADVAAAMPPRYRALVLAGAWSGLRQGELLALRRRDLDLSATPAIVHVRRRIRRTDSGEYEVDSPKSGASIRSVAIPGPLADALTSHVAEFVPAGADALILTTIGGSTPARSNLSATFRRALDHAGAPEVRFHDLRHTAQVLAAESGATTAELMARMGHSTSVAAEIYMHARAERDAQNRGPAGSRDGGGQASSRPRQADGRRVIWSRPPGLVVQRRRELARDLRWRRLAAIVLALPDVRSFCSSRL